MDSRESGCDRRYTFCSMRPVEFTVKDAALACGVSESTIRRRLPAFPHARRESDEGGAWIIPIGDLLNEGFTIDRADDEPAPSRDGALTALTDEVRLLTTEVDELERVNSRLEETNLELLRRAEAAEALLAEKAGAIDELTAALDSAGTALEAAEHDDAGLSVSAGSRSERAKRLEAARNALREIHRPT